MQVQRARLRASEASRLSACARCGSRVLAGAGLQEVPGKFNSSTGIVPPLRVRYAKFQPVA